MKPHFGHVYPILCSLQELHLPIICSHVGQRNVVEPRSSRPFPHVTHLLAFFIRGAE